MTTRFLILQMEEPGVSYTAVVGIFGTALVVTLILIVFAWQSQRNRLPERPSPGSRSSQRARDVADYEARSRQGQH